MQKTDTARGDGTGHKHRIFLVDDHPIVRTGLRLLIGQEDDLEVCGEAGSYAEALSAILHEKPDVAVIDISLDGANGIDLLRQVQKQIPATQVLVLSMHDESLYAERAMRAGARGYLMKQQKPETALNAIRTVLTGNMYLSDRVKSQMVKELVDGTGAASAKSGIEKLSDRELEIFQMLGAGYTVRDVAGRLSLSVKTVETHRDHIRLKLRLRNSTEVLHHAIRWVTGENDPAAHSTPPPPAEPPEATGG
jgi:DNA-binding NarL/FixJ family response regulator